MSQRHTGGHRPPLRQIVQNTIQKYAMLRPEDYTLVAVSGGADSVCLAIVLNEMGCRIAIAHVNHGLRAAESDEDERFTAGLAERLQVPYFSRRVLLIGGNIEASGRDARHDFFNEVADEHGFTRIAVAHTQSDRAETFLINLLHGSGLEGLASMSPVSGRIVRPLIEISRGEIETYLQHRNQSWRI